MFKKFSTHIIKILLSILVSAILIIAVGLFRLSESPLQLRTELLNKFAKIDNVDYGDVFLENPGLSTNPLITIHKVKYSKENLKIQSEKVTASWNIFKLLYGSFSLSSIEILQPKISVTYRKKRQKNEGKSTLPESLSTLHTLLDQTWLPAQNIHLKNGTVTFYKKNKQVGKIEDITFNYMTHQNSSSGRLEIRPSADSNPILLSTVYNKSKDVLEFDLKSKDLLIKKTYIPYRMRPLIDRLKTLSKAPITLDSKGSLNLSGRSLGGTIKTTLSFAVRPGATDKVKISINNDISVADQSLKVKNHINSSEFAWSDLEILWPADIGISARTWVMENMIGGTALPATLDFDLLCDLKNKSLTPENINGTVGVKNTTVSYFGDLPKIENTTAEAKFAHNKFDIKILGGRVYDLTIDNGNVLLYDLDKTKSKAKINLNIKGPLKDALTLVNKKPLEFLKTYQISPSDFDGKTDIKLELNFPLGPGLKPTDVKSLTKAHITDMAYLYKINDQDIGITKGDMALEVSNTGLKLSGDCLFNNEKGTLLWEESFEKKPEILRTFKITINSPFIKLARYAPKLVQKYLTNKDIILSQGLTKAVLIYTQKDENQSDLSLDLNLSENILDILPIHVRIPKSKDNAFKALFHFVDGELKTIDYLDFITPSIRLKSNIDYDKKGNIKDLELQEILIKDNHINLKGTLKNHKLNLKLKADEIDLLSILALGNEDSKKDVKKQKSSSTYKIESNIDAEIKSLILKEGISLPDVMVKSLYKKGHLETMTIKCVKADRTYINLFYGPKEDKTVFDFKTETMANLLSGFGIHNDTKASLVYTHAEKPLNSNQPMVGKLKIKDLHIKDVPILASLFNVMSLESLLSSLTGNGMLFMKGVAEYEYKNKKIAITKSSLTSSGIGLTAEGYIDINKGLLDLEGVIIPANVLNQAISGIPIIGSILTAGETEAGIISNSYTLKGLIDDPKISANPLSVLAPTFVKRIFSGLFGTKEKEISIENFPDFGSEKTKKSEKKSQKNELKKKA